MTLEGLAYAIGVPLISLGAIVAGRGYVKTARRIRSFATARGTVVAREVAVVSHGREARWGGGGPYGPKVTYTYTVDGVTYTSDRSTYAIRSMSHKLAEQELAAIPDEVDVYYDPAAPQEAYLQKHTPRIGHWLVAGGSIGLLLSLLVIAGAALGASPSHHE